MKAAVRSTKRRRRKFLEETAPKEYERILEKIRYREKYTPKPRTIPDFIKVTSSTLIKSKTDRSTINSLFDSELIKEIIDEYDANARHVLPVDFYLSREWNVLRRNTLIKYGLKCMRCGATKVKLHVDHIKPRSAYPHLELDPDNLQVLCEPCNSWKSNLWVIDYRPKDAMQ